MRIAKRMQRKPSPPQKFIFFDEFHLICGSSALPKWQPEIRTLPALIATQAVMRFNSGKRLRFLGATKRADGSPLKPTPKKFIPAQVQRRLAD